VNLGPVVWMNPASVEPVGEGSKLYTVNPQGKRVSPPARTNEVHTLYNTYYYYYAV